MSDYPVLTEMGIRGFNEIKTYTVQQDRKDRDILRITYEREKGSLLPRRKTFRFGRSSKMVNDSTATGGNVVLFEISPFLQNAMSELDSIIGNSYKSRDNIEALLERIDYLEQTAMHATAEMRAIVKELKN